MPRGPWLAWSVKHVILDLGVVSLGVKITSKQSLKKKKEKRKEKGTILDAGDQSGVSKMDPNPCPHGI